MANKLPDNIRNFLNDLTKLEEKYNIKIKPDQFGSFYLYADNGMYDVKHNANMIRKPKMTLFTEDLYKDQWV